MGFLARIVRFLFWLLVVSWSVALLRRLVAWMLRGAVQGPTQAGAAASPGERTMDAAGTARKLVRDPVCGIHVAEHLAIPLRDGGELVHFCSPECREKYEAGMKKREASA